MSLCSLHYFPQWDSHTIIDPFHLICFRISSSPRIITSVYRWETLDLVNQIQLPCLYFYGCSRHCWCPALIPFTVLAPLFPAILSVADTGSSLYPSLEIYPWPGGATLLGNAWKVLFPLRASGSQWLTDTRIQKLSPCLKGDNTVVAFRLQNWDQAEIRPQLKTHLCLASSPASLIFLQVSPESMTSRCHLYKNLCLGLCFWEPNLRQWWTFSGFLAFILPS